MVPLKTYFLKDNVTIDMKKGNSLCREAPQMIDPYTKAGERRTGFLPAIAPLLCPKVTFPRLSNQALDYDRSLRFVHLRNYERAHPQPPG